MKPGDPVVTVQMMDPMLVQFEVSSRDSRKYAKGDILNVFVSDENGNRQPETGMVYTVDSVANPDSRTYTVTLHVRNHQKSQQCEVAGQPAMATTERIFPLNMGPIITGDERQLVEQSCLHKIGDTTVVWRITNRKANKSTSLFDRVLHVEPIKVTCGDEVIPLLGQWKFVPVKFEDPSLVDVEHDLITDRLDYGKNQPDDTDSWSPRSVLIRRKDWTLRPGDVVQVGMAGSASQGYFVPMKAVLNDNGTTYLYVVERSKGNPPIARRIKVSVVNRVLRIARSICKSSQCKKINYATACKSLSEVATILLRGIAFAL